MNANDVEMHRRVLVTGGNGFIGRQLLPVLRDSGYQVRAALRCLPEERLSGIDYVLCGSIDALTDWRRSLVGIDCVVHLAAHVHVMRPQSDDDAIFQRVNVDGSLHLAQAALQHSVKRFVYLSSIKVNGEDSGNGVFSAADPMRPQDAYARSKAAAEKALLEKFCNSSLQIVIIRSPLVYGQGVRGNLHALMRAIDLHFPLPFASVRNSRSLVAAPNLCDLIRVCCCHSAAAGEVFLVSDDHDLSTPSLIALMASAMRRKALLWPCPPWALEYLSRVPPLKLRMQRLLGNLRIDLEKTKRLLDWSPPCTPAEGMRAMTMDF